MEKRAKRDKLARDGAVDVWMTLREAIKRTHQDFQANYHFPRSRFSLNVDLQLPEGRVTIVIEDNGQNIKPRIDFIFEGDGVTVRVDQLPATQMLFTIESDDDGVLCLSHHGRSYTADEVTKITLEPFFFGGPIKPTLYAGSQR